MSIPYEWRDRATLLHADYRETLAACDGAADLVLTSPPYCDARTYGAAVSWGDEDYAALGDAVFAALRPGGHALINVDAPVREWRKGYGTERGFHPWRLMLDWAERVGFRVPDRLAFGRLGLPGEYAGRFRNDWEPLLWFQRPGSSNHHQPPRDRARTTKQAGRSTSRRRDGSQRQRQKNPHNGYVRRGTAWNYGNVGSGFVVTDIANAGHPARWPYRLARDIIRCFCPPDGIACDPFLGAGTSLVAALEHGRRFIGGDLLTNDDGVPWVDVAAGIAEARSKQVDMFGVTP